jgi:hypothetical protein
LKGFSHHHEDKGNNCEELSLHFFQISI